jgi:hypothetical protein
MNPLDALAYLKAEVPSDDPAPVMAVDGDDAPVLRKLGGGLLVAYLVDEGDHFAYVQGRDLRAAGLDDERLHARAVANLANAAEGRVKLQRHGEVSVLFFDGHFEASLMLLDDLWDHSLREAHGGRPAVAAPARDVICFCDSSSTEGLAELRAVIARVWPGGDHLLSDRIFERKDGRWRVRDPLS